VLENEVDTFNAMMHQENLKGTIILDNGISRYIWDYNPFSIGLWQLYRIIVTFTFP
jgi:hypothetical protein